MPSSPLDTLLASAGLSRADLHKSGRRLGAKVRNVGVRDSEDLRRIKALPRRRWQEGEDVEELVEVVTQAYKTRGGSMELFPVQAVALAEMYEHGGAFLPIRVGGGKTLISLLAGRVLRARMPLILTRASLVKKTLDEADEYREHFGIPPFLIFSYERLGREQYADYLFDKEPDLIFCDEADALQNDRAACSARMIRYMDENPDTTWVGASGSMMHRKIKDFAKFLRWSLGDGAPIPFDGAELQSWGLALDEKVSPGSRMAPGELKQLVPTEEAINITTARKAFRSRLLETPGVVSTEETSVDVPLSIREVHIDIPEIMEDHFRTLRLDWATPDGHPLAEPAHVWAVARQLVCGFYNRWNPRPPPEWLSARKAWASYARYIINNNRRGFDTELQVRNAVVQGLLTFHPEFGDPLELFLAWREIKPTFVPNPEAVWFHDVTLKLCLDWWEENPEGLIWVEHRAFGEALEELTQLPYFRQRGATKSGLSIAKHRGPGIASIKSCSIGQNLQHYNRGLVVSMPSKGANWEQLTGRKHRTGQKQPVHFDVLTPCIEQWGALTQAIADARAASDTVGPEYKLSIAEIDITPARIVDQYEGPLWIKKPEDL